MFKLVNASTDNNINGVNISIIILNYNGFQDTIECLHSLIRMNHRDYQIVIVDNGSTDDSVKKLERWAETSKVKLHMLAQKQNTGFARGNNIGIRYALSRFKSEYILLLNNDTIVESDFLASLLEMFKTPKTALVGPKIIEADKKPHWQAYLFKRLNFFTYLAFLTPLVKIFINTPLAVEYSIIRTNLPQKVYAIQGSCLLFKTKVLEEIGLFDEATFLGWEEYIIAEKLLRTGYDTYVVPQSVIFHKGSKDTAKNISSIGRKNIYFESEKYFQENYLKLPGYQLWLIKIIRRVSYHIAIMTNKSYRTKSNLQ